MRRIITYIVGMVLLTVAVGCGDAHYDSRLAAIDSIIESSPDSALDLLRAMPQGSITRGDDRAYYALLLTEARYKCYDSIASTDTIDLALDHFASNGDREKLTRSLIYKGATLEELGNPTDAMRFYKQAEETASPSDYHNLGYTNLRMAKLYNSNEIVDSTDLYKYKEALHYFTLINDNHYRLVCLYSIGSRYRNTNSDSALLYLKESVRLSRLIKDNEKLYNSLDALANHYYFQEMFAEAKNCALTAYTCGKQFLFDEECLDILIKSYIKLGELDSAFYYCNFLENPTSETWKASRFITLKELALAKHDYEQAFRYSEDSYVIIDSILVNSLQQRLKATEMLYDNTLTKLDLSEARKSIILLGLLLSVVIIIALVIFMLFLQKRLKLNIKENCIKSLQLELSTLSVHQAQLGYKNQLLKDSLDNNLAVIRTFAETQLKERKQGKKSLNLEEIVKSLMSDGCIWESIKLYVQSKYDDELLNVIDSNKLLSENDVRFLCLVASNFSNNSILLLLNYTHIHSITNRKRIIAEKMNLNCNLEIFLKQHLRN